MKPQCAPKLAETKLLDRTGLLKTLQDLRDSGHKIVFTNGCFDLLHPGHIRLLETARSFGDVLVVGVNADASVKRLNKGSDRPINTELDRALVMGALACVDYVSIFKEDTPIALIEKLAPDVHVKGGDYKAESLPEYKTVTRGGGTVKIVPLVKGKSTTATVKRLQQK